MKNKLWMIVWVVFPLSVNAQDWNEMSVVPVDLTFPVVVELNGYVHVMGGGTGQGATGYHARYDASANIWEVMTPVPYLAQQPAGAVVNGKIHYCGGGYPNSGTPLNDHYSYDPSTNEWTEEPDLPTARVIHEAVGLDGKLYVLTGQPDKQRFDAFDPADDSWTQLNDLPDLNFWYGVVVATNNTIYRFGGGGYLGPQATALEYDVANDSWIALPDLPQALHAPAGAVINDALICISGGYNLQEQDEVWLYNTITQEYTAAEPLPEARDYHSLVMASDCLYSVGGYNLNVEDLGVQMLQNCEIVATGVTENEGIDKPYYFTATDEAMEIQLTGPALDQPLAVRVVDMEGRMVCQQEADDHVAKLRISSAPLSQGIYLVMIVCGETWYVENWKIGP